MSARCAPMPGPAFAATASSIRRTARRCSWSAIHDAGAQNTSRDRSFSLAMAGDRYRTDRAPGGDPVWHGPASDLRLRLCEALAWRCVEFGEFAAPHRLVHIFSHHPRLPVLCRDLAAAAAPVLARPTDDSDAGGRWLGGR